MPIAFHQSGRFAVVPLKWRVEFLRRNPWIIQASSVLEAVKAAFDQQFGQLQQFVTALEEVEGSDQADPGTSRILDGLWQDLHYDFTNGFLGYQKSFAVRVLTSFGFTPNREHLRDPLEPPTIWYLLPGPADLDIYENLWRGIFAYGFPDWPLSRRLAEGFNCGPELIDMLVRPNEYAREHPSIEAKEVYAELHALETRYDGAGKWIDLTAKAQERVRSVVCELRTRLGLPRPRRREDQYPRALAAWDSREGWTGQGYNGGHATLKHARELSGAANDHYYLAFEFITGHRYSAEVWTQWFGVTLHAGGYGQFCLNRRKTGRPRPSDRRRSVRAVPCASIEKACPPEPDSFEAIEANAVQQIAEWVSRGGTIQTAPEHLLTVLSRETIEQLRDPSNQDRIDAWRQNGCPIS